MDVPKRLHMSVSTLPYVDVPTHLHTFVLERRGRSETPSDNCFYTPRIWPRHISNKSQADNIQRDTGSLESIAFINSVFQEVQIA